MVGWNKLYEILLADLGDVFSQFAVKVNQIVKDLHMADLSCRELKEEGDNRLVPQFTF